MTEVLDDIAVVGAAPAELSAPGSAVVALGPGAAGDEIVIWHVDPHGSPTGWWTFPQAEVFGDVEAARRVLALLERRAITSCDPEDVPVLMTRLTGVAGLDTGPWWTAQVFSPIDSFRETVARRHAFARLDGPMHWIRDFDVIPPDFDALRRLSGLHAASRATAAQAAAQTASRLLRWLVGLWLETEQVKGRSRPVRAAHGAPEPLPPSWLSAVLTAEAKRLPL
ncbi:DUF6218 family protein [Kutzneria sp. NPDC051319]|uniref:DUF6218 family protein n=1 Tax=Kutzneria sp. NPDC051319 TaxID=3155047 RepID=UPI0034273720